MAETRINKISRRITTAIEISDQKIIIQIIIADTITITITTGEIIGMKTNMKTLETLGRTEITITIISTGDKEQTPTETMDNFQTEISKAKIITIHKGLITRKSKQIAQL